MCKAIGCTREVSKLFLENLLFHRWLDFWNFRGSNVEKMTRNSPRVSCANQKSWSSSEAVFALHTQWHRFESRGFQKFSAKYRENYILLS